MKSSGYEPYGRHSADPIGSQHEKGASRSLGQKKSGRDPGLTPTEKTKKSRLMKQFCKNPEGSPNTKAYRESEAWCKGCDGRRLAEAGGLCGKCRERYATAAEAL